MNKLKEIKLLKETAERLQLENREIIRKSMPGQTTLFCEYPLSQTARNTPVLPCPFPVITNPLEGTISVSKNAKELSVRVFSERGGKLLDEFKVVKRKFRK